MNQQKFLRSDSVLTTETPMFNKQKGQKQMFIKNNGSSGKHINSSSSSHNSPPINYRHQATFGFKHRAFSNNPMTQND